MIKFLAFIFLCLFACSSYAEGCRNIFTNPAPRSLRAQFDKEIDLALQKAGIINKENQVNAADAASLDSFAKAMTQGMRPSRDQASLLEIYIINYFVETYIINYFDGLFLEFQSVFDILEKYPHLSKPLFRERVLAFNQNTYNMPESLSALVKRLSKSAGKAKARLYQIEANWGFWAKALSFSDKETSKNQPSAARDSSYAAKETSRDLFLSFLDSWLSSKDRLLLKSSNIDREEKAVLLYQALKSIKANLEREGHNAKTISQMMIDLIHSFGFESASHNNLLRSKNPRDKLKGLYKILEERELLSKKLGYKNFEQAMEALNIEHPSGSSKNENIRQLLDNIEKELEKAPDSLMKEENLRVRPLSLVESPFRGCLGRDCSTSAYFKTAFDPNYIYFTMTDTKHRSHGHITLVLGAAKSEGELVKTAFVDKIQNVALDMILPMLEAVRQSMEEQGYRLALPADVGNAYGLSNFDDAAMHVKKQINPNLTKKLTGFKPHPHQYEKDFKEKNNHSRANRGLQLLEFEHPKDTQFKIKKGESYLSYSAPSNLTEKALISNLFSLRNSENIEDQVHFLKIFLNSLSILKRLTKIDRFVDSYEDYLLSIIEDTTENFKLRKAALYIFITQRPRYAAKIYQKLLNSFSNREQKILNGEISNWKKANNEKRDFIDRIHSTYIKHDISKDELKSILSSQMGKLIDLNLMLSDQEKFLFSAARKKDIETIDFLIELGMDINAVDSFGNNIALQTISEAKRAGRGFVSELIKFLELLKDRGVDFNWENEFKETALLKAIRIKDLQKGEIFQLLNFFFNHKVSLSDETLMGNDILTALVFEQKFSALDFLETLELLIQNGWKLNALVNTKEPIEAFAFYVALFNYDLSDILLILKGLKQLGVDFKSMSSSRHPIIKELFYEKLNREFQKSSALEAKSAINNTLEILDFLISEGLNLADFKLLIDEKTILIETLLAGKTLSDQDLHYFLESLIRRGADPYAQNSFGNDLLKTAEMSGQAKVVQPLLDSLKSEGIISK